MDKQIIKNDFNYIHNGKATICIIVFKLSREMRDEIDNQYLWRKFKIPYDGVLTVKGISKCQDGDEYDKEWGEAIARNRAMAKMYARLNKINRAISVYYNKKALLFAPH